jgi:serine/threonine protein kinase
VSNQAVICDFGLGKRLDDRTASTSGRRSGPPYATAPEVLRGEPFDSPADVYSYGILVWDLTRFWMRDSGKSAMPEDLLRMVERCLVFEKTERPTMKDVREHFETLFGDLLTSPKDVAWVQEEAAERDVEKVLGSQSLAMQAAASNNGLISFSW